MTIKGRGVANPLPESLLWKKIVLAIPVKYYAGRSIIAFGVSATMHCIDQWTCMSTDLYKDQCVMCEMAACTHFVGL